MAAAFRPRVGGSTIGLPSTLALSPTGRLGSAEATQTTCAAGDHATSLTRTPGFSAAGMRTPSPPMSTSKSRVDPSAAGATTYRPSGETPNRASCAAPSFFACLSFNPGLPRSSECVAAKKETSTAAILSAMVRTSTRLSLGVARMHVTASPSVSRHSRRGRTDDVGCSCAPAPVRAPAPSTSCPSSTSISRTLPSANPTNTRWPPLSNVSAVAATPGCPGAMPVTTEPCAGTLRDPWPHGMFQSRTPPSLATVAASSGRCGCHAAP